MSRVKGHYTTARYKRYLRCIWQRTLFGLVLFGQSWHNKPQRILHFVLTIRRHDLKNGYCLQKIFVWNKTQKWQFWNKIRKCQFKKVPGSYIVNIVLRGSLVLISFWKICAICHFYMCDQLTNHLLIKWKSVWSIQIKLFCVVFNMVYEKYQYQ